jgi:hypothetical protein
VILLSDNTSIASSEERWILKGIDIDHAYEKYIMYHRGVLFVKGIIFLIFWYWNLNSGPHIS